MSHFVMSILVLIAIVARPFDASAQIADGTRSAGLSGAGMTLASGVDAVTDNPANLADGVGWSARVVDLGATGLLSGATLTDFFDIFTAAGSGSAGLFGRVPEQGFDFSMVADGFVADRRFATAGVPMSASPLPALGLTYGPFGVRMRGRTFAEGHVSRGIARLASRGFEPEQASLYSAGQAEFESASIWELTAGYGRRLSERWRLGVGVRYVFGHALTQGRAFEPSLGLAPVDLSLPGVVVESPGGYGFGVDLAADFEVTPQLVLSASVLNVIQRMSWDENVRVWEATLSGDDFNTLDAEGLAGLFRASSWNDEAVSLPRLTTVEGLFEDAFQPAVVRIGAAWSWRNTTVEALGATVVTDGKLIDPWSKRVSIGAEHRIRFVTVRAGVMKAELDLEVVSAGLGVTYRRATVDIGGGVFLGSRDGFGYRGGHLSLALTVIGS